MIGSNLIRSVIWLVHFLLKARHDWFTSYLMCDMIGSHIIRNMI